MKVFEPMLLRTFLAVVEAGGFTAAARRLGLRQSTVSQHVRRLEEAAGRRLFERDTHTVEATVDGQAMIGFAQAIIADNERAMAYFAGPELRGRLRFGASEDFVLSQLPDILRRFRVGHPLVELELTVELAGVLHQKLRAGELDLVLGKRIPGESLGRPMWREPLVWTGGAEFRADLRVPDEPLPLVAYPEPSVTRARALETLRRNGIPWRIACASGSLNGLRAAVLAGLGVAVFARSQIPAGLVELSTVEYRLPDLGEVDFVLLHRSTTPTPPARALADAIAADAARLRETT
jgi:DNA-binding transcriptional LysR family regulator